MVAGISGCSYMFFANGRKFMDTVCLTGTFLVKYKFRKKSCCDAFLFSFLSFEIPKECLWQRDITCTPRADGRTFLVTVVEDLIRTNHITSNL